MNALEQREYELKNGEPWNPPTKLKPKGKPAIPLSPEQIEEIQLLHQLRVPKSHIAKHYGISPPAVTYYVGGIFSPLPVGDILALLKKHNIILDTVRKKYLRMINTTEQQA